MHIVRDARSLDAFAGGVFVPTMGALHDGHRALLKAARVAQPAGPLILSIFVNPTQFAPGEDFSRYPRTLDDDLAIAEGDGVDVAFVPEVDVMYPAHAPVPVPVLPPVATEPGLEDACRPGHFAGVCQVVARLFDLVRPRRAVFGEKDWQQHCVIRAMVTDAAPRWGDLEIVPVPTVREPDGLALSSRNRYLAPEDRGRALGLSQALAAARAADVTVAAETAMHDVLAVKGLAVEYAVVRDAESLTAPRPSTLRRALIAARLRGPTGTVRLIDTMPMP